MDNSFRFLTIIFSALLLPTVIHALPADRSCNFARHCVSRSPVGDRSDRAGATLAQPAVTTYDRRAAHTPPYVFAAFPFADGPPLTVLDYTFAPQGVVGSVGYIHLTDDHPIAAEAGLAASLGFDRPDSLVGAGLHFDFR